MDVALEWLNPLFVPTKATEFLLDIGTAELLVTVKPLRVGERFARLHLAEPVLALPGDRFVLRRPSPALTVSGGMVIDPFPPRRLNRAKTFERLDALASASAEQRVEILTEESAAGLSVSQLVRLTGMPPETIAGSRNLILINGQHLVSKRWVERQRRKLVEWLAAFHAKNPAMAGAPVSQARLGVDPVLLGPVFDNFPDVSLRGDLVALSSHQPQVSAVDAQARDQIEFAFRQAAFQPPAPNEVMAAAGNPKTARGHLESLVKDGKLIRISGDLIFHAEVICHIRQSLATHKGRRFSVADFKSWTNVSRKYAIPLLEYLDQQRVTKREGDVRVVL
jgi:selenocysteine-specific elongation factor